VKPTIRKGRGALSNPAGRFETLHRQDFDDGWLQEDDAAPPLPTVVVAEPAKSIITRNESKDLGFSLSINPYRGCGHGCPYCFARPSHAYLNLSPGLDFETKLFYKPNAAALFEQELRKPGYRCDIIVVGVNTDAYQPIERTYRVTRSLLEVAQRFRQPLSLITKGASLMERDLDILGEMGRAGLASVTVSITTLDDELKRKLEPRTSSPAARLKLVRRLAEAGVPVSVNVAPIIPFVTDAELERILEASQAAGATGAGYVMLRLPWEVKTLFQEWLEAHFPDRAARVMSLMRQLHGGDPEHRAKEPVGVDEEDATQESVPEVVAVKPDKYRSNPYYSAEWGVRQRGRGAFADLIEQRFDLACRRLSLNRRHYHLDTSQFRVPPASGDQLGMDF
jgi:DNA repair photolyase